MNINEEKALNFDDTKQVRRLGVHRWTYKISYLRTFEIIKHK